MLAFNDFIAPTPYSRDLLTFESLLPFCRLKMSTDAVAITLFFAIVAVSSVTVVLLWTADSILHRPIRIRIPSVYEPIARLGFHRNRRVRRIFRFLFSDVYRKRFWNPIMGSMVKTKGLDRKRHLQAGNMHAACSVLAFAVMVLSLYFACQAARSAQLEAKRTCFIFAAGAGVFELVFNAPAIILSRYLYLLTVRRSGLNSK